MTPVPPLSEEKWPLARRCEVIGRFWALHWTAIQLNLLREKGEADLVEFKYSILRRHQRSHFLQGVDKLGIDRALPPAVIAGRYHYFSNAIGGLPMQYIEESPRKVWIRYMAPAWSFPGASLFAVPWRVERAMFAGWHPFNGLSLGSKRLGFVVTKVFQEGEPYDEGYFEEFDRELDDDERIQYRPVTISPDFDADRAPKLDPEQWPEERLIKARRNFALGYAEDGIQTLLSMYGVPTASQYLGQSCRLAAIQYFHDFRVAFDVTGNKAGDFIKVFAGLSELAGEEFRVAILSPGRYQVRRKHKIFASGEVAREIYAALFEFQKMAAKVLSPRIRLELASLTADGAAQEEWLVEDVEHRLF